MTGSAAFAPWSYRGDGRIERTPAIAGDVVYLATAGGGIHALRAATGEPVWTRRLPAAAASPPVVSGGVVVLNVGQGDKYGGGAEMVGLDAETGEQRWDSPFGFSGEAAVDERGRVLVASGSGRLSAVDVATGDTAWRTDLSELERAHYREIFYSHIFTINTPVSPAGGGRVLVHLSTSVCYCLDAADGSVVWRTAYGSYYNARSAGAVLDGVVYLGTGDGGLVALATDSGETRYERRPPWERLHAAAGWPDPAERSPVIDGRMVVAGGAVWFGARNGFLCSYRPGQAVHMEKNFGLGWGAPHPVPAGDRVLALWPRGQVAAFAADQAGLQWHTRIRRHLTSLAAAGTIFVYGRDRTLMAHEAGAGNGPRRGLLR